MPSVRLVVTSLVRHAGLVEPSGFVRVLDLADGSVVAAAPVPESAQRARDPNPRGGLRGAKGVSVWGDRIVVANVERLFVLGRDWALEGEITHPWMGGIHDILCERDGIWVTCTDSELLLKVDWDGRLVEWWSWRDDDALVKRLNFASLPPFDPSLDYRDPLAAHKGAWNAVHLNAVTRDGDDLIVLFGRVVPSPIAQWRKIKGAAVRAAGRVHLANPAVRAVRRRRIARIDADAELPVERVRGARSALIRVPSAKGKTAELVLSVPASAGVPNHNVVLDNGRVLFNDSNEGAIVGRETGRDEETRVPIPGAPPFPRGLVRLADGRFVVGSQRPAAVHVVDLDETRVVSSVALGGHENESVYAVSTLPDSFDDPPPELTFRQ